ncbi:MAG TPA: PEP/pyruvate-binding domain-containing protein [Anaerolineae bacterium]|nr:PEP/pyruvate-binding domain-containing protein [Anaerolineae bacterium]
MTHYVLPLNHSQATLDIVGGKGASLAKLANAGLPVPGGFHVTTDAYKQFVAENDLQPRILATLQDVDTAQPATLETASTAIRALFTQSPIPPTIADAIRAAYLVLPVSSLLTPNSQLAVAVRSSATAEDLPDASFAGQQDTYLNIQGVDAVLDAVRRCWASLWTARAIGYRARQGIAPDSVALAVVVQTLVFADAAGIMFTANPLNGRRDQAIINAAWGLGEAVVGGLVTPDTYTVDKADGQVVGHEIADKQTMTVRTASGTEEQPVSASLRQTPSLTEAQIVELGQLGVQIETLYGMPMDVEWCLADGRFFVVQARPITTLSPEAPVAPSIAWTRPNPKGQYLRGSIADFMPNPVSPLFETLAIPTIARVGVKEVLRPLTRSEPILPDYIVTLNSYVYINAGYNLREWWWIVTRMMASMPRMLRDAIPLWRDEIRPRYVATVARWRDRAPEALAIDELWAGIQEVNAAAMLHFASLLVATTGASAGSEMLFSNVYNKLIRRKGDPEAPVFLMGYDSTPILAEKSLYDLAEWTRARPDLTDYLLATPTADLVAAFFSPSPPLPLSLSDFHARLQTHLAAYGHIIYDLDFAKGLPCDDPAPLLETLKMYLRGEGANPHERQQATEERREQAVESTRARLKGLRRWAFDKTLKMGQTMAAVRENALADIGLGYPVLRALLRELGRRCVQAGALAAAEDIFWLRAEEAESAAAALARGESPANLAESVAQRRAYHAALERITPPPMLPPRKKYMGIDMASFTPASEESQVGGTLKGIAASAGQVTATACVLHGPEDFDRMQPGCVLVAATTTPAWTPLFAMAAAVVTDIGGPLSHGSIVAREYGIPAVMGTGVATRRIHNGQPLTVDGNAGTVTLHEGPDGASPEGKAEVSPPTEWNVPYPKSTYSRASIVELLPDPLTPLFATLGGRAINTGSSQLFSEIAGPGVMPEQIFVTVNDYAYYQMYVTFKVIWRMLAGIPRFWPKFMRGEQRWRDEARPHYLAVIEAWRSKPLAERAATELLDGAHQIVTEAVAIYNVFQSGVIGLAMLSELAFTAFYNTLVKRRNDPPALTFLLGFDSAPILAEKSLYDVAEWTRAQPDLAEYILNTPTADLVAAFFSPSPPHPLSPSPPLPLSLSDFRARLQTHLDAYGHIIYDLDFAKPVAADDPTLLLETCKMYLNDQGTSPYARQQEQIARREAAAATIEQRLKRLRLKWFRKLLSWRRYIPMREDALADIGLGYPLLRQMLRELGGRLVRAGMLAQADDVYWLNETEARQAASALEQGVALDSMAETIQRRKAVWRAEKQVTPPSVLPERSKLTGVMDKVGPSRVSQDAGDSLKGAGSSPGRVTAPACVLHGPEDFAQMQPGAVLVAAITTPAWTPLFTMAAAVVTDIGGPLSHGSIVAREYGIPAVLGTGVATQRIHSGQMLTVDGGAGTVKLGG